MEGYKTKNQKEYVNIWKGKLGKYIYIIFFPRNNDVKHFKFKMESVC